MEGEERERDFSSVESQAAQTRVMWPNYAWMLDVRIIEGTCCRTGTNIWTNTITKIATLRPFYLFCFSVVNLLRGKDVKEVNVIS